MTEHELNQWQIAILRLHMAIERLEQLLRKLEDE